MLTKFFSRVAITTLLVAVGVIQASAQVTQISGKVKMKQADGTEVPVRDAIIDIYRTDISGKYNTKTDKNGNYIHAGIPFSGTYAIAVSAPGARPTYSANLRLNQQPTNDFTLDSGDGSKITIDQIKANFAAGGAAAGGGGGSPRSESKEERAKREEMAKEAAKIEEGNKKIVSANEVVTRTFKAGNDAFQAKRYDEALASYDEGLQADPEQGVLYLNKSVVLRTRGVDKYNVAVKAKDTAGKDTAKADFVAAADSAEKAVKFYRARNSAAPAGGGPAAAGGAQQSNELLNYLSSRSETYRIALETNAQVAPDQAATAIQEYITAESDPAKKAKAEASLGDALFRGGRIEESVAAYRKILAANPSNLEAMYGLGIALAADPTGTKNTEARDLLQKYADKADPASPRKQEAIEMAKYLDDTIKNPAKPLEIPKGTLNPRRKKN